MTTNTLIFTRLTALQHTLKPGQWLLLSGASDIFYFSRFRSSVPATERSVFLLIGANQAHLLLQNFLPIPTDFSGFVSQGHTSPQKLHNYLDVLRQQQSMQELFIDDNDLRVSEWLALQQLPGVKLATLSREQLWQLRQYKDVHEQTQMRNAIRITKKILSSTLKSLRLGQTELDIATLIKSQVLAMPNCELSFDSIVAFDQHSALPHHQPTSRKLRHGSVVLIDMGVKYQGYCADMTRTIFWLNPQEKSPLTPALHKKRAQFNQIQTIVKTAYQAAADLIDRPNITAGDLDLACRQIITKAGYGNQFIHTTGHGLGLDIHEPPSLYHTNPTPLQSSMVITIEPGIYLPGVFGYRFENTLFIKNKSDNA